MMQPNECNPFNGHLLNEIKAALQTNDIVPLQISAIMRILKQISKKKPRISVLRSFCVIDIVCRGLLTDAKSLESIFSS